MKKRKDFTLRSRELFPESYRKFGRGILEVSVQRGKSRGTFLITRWKPAVAIVAVTAKNEIVLIRKFEFGPAKERYTLPMGFMKNKETAIAAAGRELLEETGFRGKVKIAAKMERGGYYRGTVYCTVATSCVQTGKSSNPDEEWEWIRSVETVPIPRFRDLLRKGAITHPGFGYIGLDYLGFLSRDK